MLYFLYNFKFVAVLGDAILWLHVRITSTHWFRGITVFNISLYVLLNALECQLMCLFKERVKFLTSLLFFFNLSDIFIELENVSFAKELRHWQTDFNIGHDTLCYISYSRRNINVWHLSSNPVGYSSFIFTKNQKFRLLRPACEVDCVSKPSDDYNVTVGTAAYES